MKMPKAVLFLTLMFIPMAWSVSPLRGQEAHPKLSRKELHSLITNAKTAEDHKKLAAYYRDKAQEANEKVADHQDMLQAYVDNPTGHRPMKSPNPQDFCNSLIRIYREEAKQDLSLAEYHEGMASDVPKTQ
jgi:hypothetical protein